jgi:hypothetical protein
MSAKTRKILALRISIKTSRTINLSNLQNCENWGKVKESDASN